MDEIILGSKVKDQITGFEGIATGRVSYITGCDQYLVQPPCTDGNWKESKWIDSGRLTVVENELISLIDVQSEQPGCDDSAPCK